MPHSYPSFAPAKPNTVLVRKRLPRQVEFISQNVGQSNNLNSREVLEKLIKHIQPQRPRTFNQVPCFFKRLTLTYVAEKLKNRSLGR